jgi:hypothetical protein
MRGRATTFGPDAMPPLRAALWFGLAMLLCLSVLVLNGRPLFYFDTAGYIEQGDAILEKFSTAPQHAAGKGAASVQPGNAPTDRTVDGSRSIFYSLVVGVLSQFRVLELLNLIHAAAVVAALALAFDGAARGAAAPFRVPVMTAIAVLAALPSAMPFFVAYLMPDIFAPVLILVIGSVVAFGRDLRLWHYLALLAIGGFAIVSHLSHFAIAAAMLPAAVLVALILRRGTWWRAALFLLALLALAFAQQATIRAVATKVVDKEVMIRPFMTARLIQDGPGYDYLADRCPDPGYPTCALYAELQFSQDPWRLTASHILFRQTRDLGSFMFLPPEDQIRVARDQGRFLRDVALSRPLSTAMAFLRNTLTQTGMYSIDMTLASDSMVEQHRSLNALSTGPFQNGRLTDTGRGWVVGLTAVQGWYYLFCLVLVAALLLRPAGMPPEVRAFAAILVLGILANAFVCGGVSQPATRYGARMVWLLPVAAAFVVMFRNSRRSR